MQAVHHVQVRVRVSASVVVPVELDELAPAADETAAWVEEAMDVLVPWAPSVVHVPVEAQTLAEAGPGA